MRMILWWEMSPINRIIFWTVILFALTIARWLWSKGDVWTWGEDKDSTAKCGLLDLNKEKKLDENKDGFDQTQKENISNAENLHKKNVQK